MNRIYILIIILCVVSCNDTTKSNPTKEEKSLSEITPTNMIAVDEENISSTTEQKEDNHSNNDTLRSKKWIIKNLMTDTTNAFGIWTIDNGSPRADFSLTKDSFYIPYYNGDGEILRILDRNEIRIIYRDHT